MNLIEQIDTDIKNAMREGNEEIKNTLRYLKSSIKNYQISKGADLSDTDIIQVVQKEVKQRKDAADQYKNAARQDLAQKEEAEIQILKKYLPEQISDEQLKTIVTKAIDQTGAKELKDIGKVMSQVLPQVQGKADGGRVSSIVREILQS